MAESVSALSERVQSLRTRLRNMRERTEGMSARAQRLATSAAGAYVYAKLEANAGASGMATVAGIDPKLVWGLGAALIGDQVGGRMGELLGDAGVGIVCAYAYAQGQGT